MASLAFRAGGPVAIAALAGLFVLAPARHDDRTVSASQDQDTSISATLKDQVDLAVTVYNSNIALVRDVRQVALPSGALDLSLLDIAASVNPATVHFRSLSEPSKLGVLEQNYQYDLLGSAAAAEEVRRPRSHARAHAAGERHDAPGGSDARACSRSTTRRSGRSATRSSPGSARSSTGFPRFPTTCAAGPRWCGSWTTAADGSTGSRRRTWQATCRGTPTTC